MLGPQGGSSSVITGTAGYITAAGAKAAIMSRWNIRRSGTQPDGKPRLRFRAQFSYVNDTLMNLKHNGTPLQKRVVVEMRTERHGHEKVDILGWGEWKYEGGILTLEDIMHSEGMGTAKPHFVK
jgi:hypothetical protein